ncbi:MAG TPA: type II secretion system F family protein [Myxococcota bacterium]|nr:type II secretion system F family protein [Myxococcota bacterium]
MPTYNWVGKTRDGLSKKGVIVADGVEAAMATLRAQAITPTTVKPKPKDLAEIFPFLQKGVSIRDLVIFTRQFATMIDAGLPLVQCLDILGTQQENPAFKKVIMQIKGDVESGSTFSDALGKHPKVFDRLFVNLVAAGEVGGILDTILARLAAYLEKADKLRRKVKGALTYPAAVTAIAIIVVVVMLTKVIPVFEKMFKDFGGTLPAPTQMVINISHWLQAYILYLIIGVGLAAYGLKRWYGTEKGRAILDALFLKSPIFGSLLQKVAVARFSRTLSTMLSSGVPILDALEIVARTAGNVVVEKEILMTKSSIAEGKTIAEPLQGSKVFPGMVVQMISVGEQTGAMDAMLGKIADFYDDEVDTAVDALTSLLEPLLMVGLGGTIGGLLIAMYLPIFKIAENVN